MPLLHRALAGFSFAALVIAPPAMAAKSRPDLSVKALSESATATRLTATATIVNAGKAKAPKAAVRFTAGGTTVTVKVKALAPKKQATVKATLKAPAGAYQLKVCVRSKAREANKRNDCRTAAKHVPSAPPGQTRPPVPAPVPTAQPSTPAATATPTATPTPSATATPGPTAEAPAQSTLDQTTKFLYEAQGVSPTTIQPQRAAVVRGHVDQPGVTVTVKDHPELGHTTTHD